MPLHKSCPDIICEGANCRRQDHAKEDGNNYAEWVTADPCSSLGAVWFTSTALAMCCQQSFLLHWIGGEKKIMTLLRTLVSEGREPSSGPCSRSDRAEINSARKMLLKYPAMSYWSFWHLHFYCCLFSSTTKKVNHFDFVPVGHCLSHCIAMKNSWRGGRCIPDVKTEPHAETCTEEHLPYQDAYGREPPGDRCLEGQRAIISIPNSN